MRLFQLLLFLIALSFVPARPASAGMADWLPEFENGNWRLELSGDFGMARGRRDREGDRYGRLTLEYEMPWFPRTTVGVKANPLFVYFQDKPADTIYGVSGGLSARVYQHRESLDGLFGEVGGSVLWHSRHFQGNSTRVNFLIEAGVGYKFRESPWHVSAHLSHISNAGTGGDNDGVNGIGLAIGFTF